MVLRLVVLVFALACATQPAAQGSGRGQNNARFDALARQVDAAIEAADYARAEDLARQRLSLADYVVQRKRGHAYPSLGFVLRLRGKHADAEAVPKQGVPLLEKALGRDSNQVVRTLSHLAEIYTAQSRYAEARAALEDCLARAEKGDSTVRDIDVARLHEDLARVELAVGRY